MIDIPYQQNSIKAYLALPQGQPPFPALVAIQEWWGLNDQIRNTADRLAAEGYLVLAPDLYDGNVADHDDEAERLLQRYDPDAPKKVTAAYEALRARDDVQKVGSVGWCMGGRMSLHVATSQPGLDACVVFYGRPENYFGSIADIRCPTLGLFGELDGSIPLERVERLDSELDEAQVEHEIVVYPNTDHAFFNEQEHSYHPQSAQDAWQRTLTFFGAHLR